MSVSLYFGLPGCGKTTLLAKHAKITSDWINGKGWRAFFAKCPYKHIYGNVNLVGIPHYTKIEYKFLGMYDVRDALVLIDEATLEQDNRDFKSFKQYQKEFFLLHRHYNLDIRLYTQQWDGVDKKIRVITDRVYYLYKGFWTRKYITKMYRVPYGIIIPDPKKSDSEKLGEIVQGYCKPNFIIRLLTPPIFRARYYKYFDSWEAPALPPLPKEKNK